jgi:hypothetical protein
MDLKQESAMAINEPMLQCCIVRLWQDVKKETNQESKKPRRQYSKIATKKDWFVQSASR